MPGITAILADDEIYSLEDLAITLAQHFPDVQIVAKAASVAEAKTLIEAHRPDVVFLDIQLNESTAFDLLNLFPDPDFGVVLVSGYSDFGIRAVKYGVIDYLMKPVNTEELRIAMERVYAFVAARRRPEEKIVVNSAQGFHLICIKDILRLEAAVNYTRIFIRDGSSVLISKTLMEFEKALAGFDFFRVHRSHLVNMDYLREYSATANGRYMILKDDVKVGVSKNKVKDIMMYVEKMYRHKI
jgi:two-component system LytT family response regulator